MKTSAMISAIYLGLVLMLSTAQCQDTNDTTVAQGPGNTTTPAPTETPVGPPGPTEAPAGPPGPTEAPAGPPGPTEAPAGPTEAPAGPTEALSNQTEAPATTTDVTCYTCDSADVITTCPLENFVTTDAEKVTCEKTCYVAEKDGNVTRGCGEVEKCGSETTLMKTTDSTLYCCNANLCNTDPKEDTGTTCQNTTASGCGSGGDGTLRPSGTVWWFVPGLAILVHLIITNAVVCVEKE